jgi:hypothetical protein
MTNTDNAPAAVYEHCCTVYDAMFAKARRIEVPSEETSMIVYEGHLTRLFRDLRLSVPYYSLVTKELRRMGCIRQLRRGGGTAESQWELICSPSLELFKDATTRNRPANKIDALEQQVKDLREMVHKLSSQVNQLSLFVDGWRHP